MRTARTTTTTTTTTTRPLPPTRRVRRFVLIGAMTAVVALGAAACGGGDDDNAKAASTSTTVAAATTPTTAQVASGNSGGNSGGNSSGNSGGNSGGTTAPKPVINSFQTPENIDCHNGDFQMFTASWTTTNAVKVTISIDGPGVYKTYDGPNGSDSLPFNCSSSHSFLLTAYGADGQTATQTITLQPRNVQTPTTTSQP